MTKTDFNVAGCKFLQLPLDFKLPLYVLLHRFTAVYVKCRGWSFLYIDVTCMWYIIIAMFAVLYNDIICGNEHMHL